MACIKYAFSVIPGYASILSYPLPDSNSQTVDISVLYLSTVLTFKSSDFVLVCRYEGGCGSMRQSQPTASSVTVPIPRHLNILLIDIETLPALGWFWNLYETNIIATVQDWRILSFSAKWLGGEQETHIDHKTDRLLVGKIWKLLDRADIVIAHNGDSFDIRKINARFLFHGLTPPSPYKTIDTLKISRRNFGLLSHKQDDIGQYLKTGRKIKTDKDLWLDCIAGKKKALKLMAEYNAQDVVLLEKNYLKFRPWIKNPNLAVFADKTVCPKCSSHKLQRRGFTFANTTKYQRVQCQNCGGWSRTSLNLQEIKPLISI